MDSSTVSNQAFPSFVTITCECNVIPKSLVQVLRVYSPICISYNCNECAVHILSKLAAPVSHLQPGLQQLIAFLSPWSGKLYFLVALSFGGTVLALNPTPHLRVRCQLATAKDWVFERSSFVIQSDEGLTVGEVSWGLKYERDPSLKGTIIHYGWYSYEIDSCILQLLWRLLSFSHDLV